MPSQQRRIHNKNGKMKAVIAVCLSTFLAIVVIGSLAVAVDGYRQAQAAKAQLAKDDGYYREKLKTQIDHIADLSDQITGLNLHIETLQRDFTMATNQIATLGLRLEQNDEAPTEVARLLYTNSILKDRIQVLLRDLQDQRH